MCFVLPLIRCIGVHGVVCNLTATDVCEDTSFTSLENLLKTLKAGVQYECVRIEVRRSVVVDDALRVARKRKFDPSKSLKVCVYLYCSLFSQLNAVNYAGFVCWGVCN